MDIALILLQDNVPQVVQVGAGVYLIFNTVLLVVIAFWVGVQWNRINNHSGWLKELQAKVESSVVPAAEMKTKLDNIKDDVEHLTRSFDQFQRSIFIEAMRLGANRRDPADDAAIG